jgi:hypothetical protein
MLYHVEQVPEVEPGKALILKKQAFRQKTLLPQGMATGQLHELGGAMVEPPGMPAGVLEAWLLSLALFALECYAQTIIIINLTPF